MLFALPAAVIAQEQAEDTAAGMDEVTLTDSIPAKVSAYGFNAGVLGVASSNGAVPFWMRANQFGSIPVSGVSAALTGRFEKRYSPDARKNIVDWGMAVEARGNIGSESNLILVEANLKGRLGIFQLLAGRAKDVSGLIDTSLSSGSFSLSGNALGIPKIELSIPEFWSVPLTSQLFAFKGNVSHGWMGNVPIQYGTYAGQAVASYFHHKSLHGRFGKPTWKWKLYGGINHDVIWGNEAKIFGNQYKVDNDLKALWYVFSGSSAATSRDISKVGNHQGAIDYGFEVEAGKVKILAYRQQFYDKGALFYLGNILDGLNGLSLTNVSRERNKNMGWNKFLFEIFYSKNQAGEVGAVKTPSGPEYYYNHAVYQQGFSYKGSGLGTPLITRAEDARAELPNHRLNYFINNRVLAFHFGMEGYFKEWTFRSKLTYSKNWGEYRTSGIKYQWFNGKQIPQQYAYGIFRPVGQFSGYLEASRPLKNNFNLGFALAVDQGNLLYNSVGGYIKLTRTW